jgi:hypothetical protein
VNRGSERERRAELAARAQDRLGLPPLTLAVAGERCTIDRGRVRLGADGNQAIAVELAPDAFTDLAAGVYSSVGLLSSGAVRLPSDHYGPFASWDHVLRALLDGVPLYEPGALTLRDPAGLALSLDRTFTPADRDEDIAHFLAEAGYLHLRGWIDPGLLPRIAREVQDAAAAARPGEAPHWWSRMQDGSERCTRVMYLLGVSPTMAGLVASAPYERLGQLFRDGHRRFPEQPQSSEALLKPLGVERGLTELPWHRDCSLGGHDYHCAAYAVGLPLTATSEERGHLRVVAGSHRAAYPPPGSAPGYESELPIVPVHTEPGDLTVHVGCTLHGTRPSPRWERSVAYTTFALGPLPGEVSTIGSARMPELDTVRSTPRP